MTRKTSSSSLDTRGIAELRNILGLGSTAWIEYKTHSFVGLAVLNLGHDKPWRTNTFQSDN